MRKNVDMRRQKTVRSMGAVGVALALTLGTLVGGSAASAASPTGGLAHQTQAEDECLNGQFFLDVSKGQSFFENINRLGCLRISTGTVVPGGRVFAPKESVSREAMAAFLYRWGTARGHLEGYPFETPAVSPFADVQPGDKFYREITWLHHKGIATGTRQKSGKPLFQPKEPITREAMAAFFQRYDSTEGGEGEGLQPHTFPSVSPFVDLTPESRFYYEITQVGRVMKGFKVGTGREFRPKENVTREAMAAFISRISPLSNGLKI